MYIPKHFYPKELVPPDIFNKRGNQAIELIDERVLITLDKLRETVGTCVINDCMFNDEGRYTPSGLRTSDSPAPTPPAGPPPPHSKD